MWGNEIINFVIRHLVDKDKFALRELINRYGLSTAVDKICTKGENLYNKEKIPVDIFNCLREELSHRFPEEAKSDSSKILALLYFRIGLSFIQSTDQPGYQSDLKSESSRSALIAEFPERKASTKTIDEELISTEFAKAQQARWLCEYAEVRRLTEWILNYLYFSEDHSPTARRWRTKLLDLQVETIFTISNRTQFARALEMAEKSIWRWIHQKDTVMLAHAYLRKSLVYRQLFTYSQCHHHQVNQLIHDSLLNLYEAKEDLLKELKKMSTLDAISATVKLHSHLAKSFIRAHDFNSARAHLREAKSICADIEDLRPRRLLDLLISQALFVREHFIDKHIFGDVKLLDDLDESINKGLNYPLEFPDVALQEMLWKSYIPILVGTNRREQAEEVFRQSMERSRKYRLYHQQRDLNYLANAFGLRSI